MSSLYRLRRSGTRSLPREDLIRRVLKQTLPLTDTSLRPLAARRVTRSVDAPAVRQERPEKVFCEG